MITKLNMHIDKVGGQQEFASMLGCSKQLVNYWYNGKIKPSPRMAVKIESLTRGKVKRKDILPDVFGRVA